MLPDIILHIGISVDGRTVGGSGSQEAQALFYKLAAYWKADADLSGSNTVLAAFLPEEPEKVFPAVFEQMKDMAD